MFDNFLSINFESKRLGVLNFTKQELPINVHTSLNHWFIENS